MSVSTLDTAPQAHTAWGAASNAAATTTSSLFGDTFTAQAIARASRPDYFGWLDHVRAAAACTRPIRLSGDLHTIRQAGGAATITDSRHTATMPDGMIYKACGNRRASVCPACARTYQQDAYQLLRAGLVGGKGIPTSVAAHPAVFATFTAPSFGPVHTRTVKRHTCTNRKRCDCRPEPCHARRSHPRCAHGEPAACFARHNASDPQLGKPICLDCYDHTHQVVWNGFAGELWRRTKQAVDRHLAHLAKQRGHRRIVIGYHPTTGKAVTVAPVRSSASKVAEFQTRGVVHFHALIRLDGIDPEDPAAILPPPPGFTADDIAEAVAAAVEQVSFTTPTHPDQPDGWPIAWGQQVDTRPITMTGGEVTDSMAAGYLAKYATKSTEATGHRSTRLDGDSIDDYADPDGDHTARLINACWHLGRPTHEPAPLAGRPRTAKPTPGLIDPWTCPQGHTTRLPVCLHCPAERQPDVDAQPANQPPANPYVRLRRWAHMLGFGGHFLTKTRHYSVTFGQLRDVRRSFRRTEQPETFPAGAVAVDHDEETTLLVNTLNYAGTGWHTAADALLANTAAALARERQAAGREDLAHAQSAVGIGGTTGDMNQPTSR